MLPINYLRRLDPTTRRVQLPGDNLALITDTVGFIQNFPPH
jgi:50S ribosomal subunit-associated GTPase HflX